MPPVDVHFASFRGDRSRATAADDGQLLYDFACNVNINHGCTSDTDSVNFGLENVCWLYGSTTSMVFSILVFHSNHVFLVSFMDVCLDSFSCA